MESSLTNLLVRLDGFLDVVRRIMLPRFDQLHDGRPGLQYDPVPTVWATHGDLRELVERVPTVRTHVHANPSSPPGPCAPPFP